MTNKKQIEMLKEYLKVNIAPILVDFITKDFFEDKVVIDSKCNKEELNEIYDKEKILPPKWYSKLIEEQKKFIEILKYKKVSTFKLPEDIRIIITANKINKDKIAQEIFELTSCIGGKKYES